MSVGAWGDAVVFGLEEDAFELVDARGESRIGRQRLVQRMVIKNGAVYSERVMVGI